ncbi:MAG: cold shock domain-containing protein [Pseudomonadota bacterium]
MATGVMKWFNNDKGYGFVTMDDEDKSEVFVHHSAIDMEGFKSLKHGQRVEFSLYYGPKGLTASYLKQIEPEDADTPVQDEAADFSVTPPQSQI